MYKVQTNLKNWVEKTKLKVTSYLCPICGDDFPTVVPVFVQDCVGLASEIHGCGENYFTMVLRPLKEVEGSILDSVKEEISYDFV